MESIWDKVWESSRHDDQKFSSYTNTKTFRLLAVIKSKNICLSCGESSQLAPRMLSYASRPIVESVMIATRKMYLSCAIRLQKLSRINFADECQHCTPQSRKSVPKEATVIADGQHFYHSLSFCVIVLLILGITTVLLSPLIVVTSSDDSRKSPFLARCFNIFVLSSLDAPKTFLPKAAASSEHNQSMQSFIAPDLKERNFWRELPEEPYCSFSVSLARFIKLYMLFFFSQDTV